MKSILEERQKEEDYFFPYNCFLLIEKTVRTFLQKNYYLEKKWGDRVLIRHVEILASKKRYTNSRESIMSSPASTNVS